MMNGIDISSWQEGIDLNAVPTDFIIIKATEGTRFIDDSFKTWANWCKSHNKRFGFYHFINTPESGGAIKDQAKYFYNTVKNYLNYGIPFLDWEDGGSYSKILSYGPKVAKEWLDEFYRLSGKRAMIYMSQSVTVDYNWSNVAKDYKLWMAQYPDYNIQNGYLNTPWHTDQGYWDKITILQYSGNGRLSGYGGGLDLDKAYITKEEWDAIVKGNAASTSPSKSKTTDSIAQEVLEGKWGDGEDRYYRLKAAGYDYDTIQNKVNELVKNPQPKKIKKSNEQVAAEVIQGKWGKFNEWQTKLEKDGYKYNDILSIVINTLLDNQIELLARQVLDGMWGNGQDREDKLNAAGYNYDIIQNKVNEILK